MREKIGLSRQHVASAAKLQARQYGGLNSLPALSGIHFRVRKEVEAVNPDLRTFFRFYF